MELPILEIREVSFQNILQYPNLQIHKNKVTFVRGESGCGKSTLFRLLNGTLNPTTGTVFYQQKEISSLDTITLRREVSLVNQMVYLFDGTVLENFKRFYEAREQVIPTEERIKQCLHCCCMDVGLDQNCATMSGGERQRIYIAIYLSFQPKVLLLDEPTSALDKANGEEMLRRILSFCKENEMTVVVISHDQQLADLFAEKQIVLTKAVKEDTDARGC